MALKITGILDDVVREPTLSNFAFEAKLLAGSKREAALYQLEGALDRHSRFRGNEQMEMVGHQDKLVD